MGYYVINNVAIPPEAKYIDPDNIEYEKCEIKQVPMYVMSVAECRELYQEINCLTDENEFLHQSNEKLIKVIFDMRGKRRGLLWHIMNKLKSLFID